MATNEPSLDTLEVVARAAQDLAPGPYKALWIPGDEARGIDSIRDASGYDVVIADSGVYPPHGPVAEYIAAASPDVVLALIALARKAGG